MSSDVSKSTCQSLGIFGLFFGDESAGLIIESGWLKIRYDEAAWLIVESAWLTISLQIVSWYLQKNFKGKSPHTWGNLPTHLNKVFIYLKHIVYEKIEIVSNIHKIV